MKRKKTVSVSKISFLPDKIGVYFFYAKGKVLYIGKASSIKKRVKSHFQKSSHKDKFFAEKTSKIGYIETNSEAEALILESKLIKKLQPKYNVLWRDDKNYLYAAITREKFPRVFIARRKKGLRQKADFAGPFADGKALRQTLKILRKVFPYRTCGTLPKKPCLWYQLDRCPAPCLSEPKTAKEIPSFENEMRKVCQKNAKKIAEILKGKKNKAIDGLRKEMRKLSREEKFEKAEKIKRQIASLEKTMANAEVFGPEEKQLENWPKIEEFLRRIIKTKKEISRIESYDISNIQGKWAAGSMAVFINGLPKKKEYRKFKIRIPGKPNDTAMLEETLSRRFKHSDWNLPEVILIDGGKAQLNAALRAKAKRKKEKEIKAISLAKKKNELFIEEIKKPLLIEDFPTEVSNFILRTRDEAHRFAVSYHKSIRKKFLIKE